MELLVLGFYRCMLLHTEPVGKRPVITDSYNT